MLPRLSRSSNRRSKTLGLQIRSMGKVLPNCKTKDQAKARQARTTRQSHKQRTTPRIQKNNTGKWCEFHKSSTHNTSESRAKQSLVAELKASESDACSDSESEPDKGNDKGNQIIDVEPNATVSTTKIQKEEPKDPEEAERLFHSKMWEKGSPLQFIVDSGSQKNLISIEVVKRLGLSTTAHPQPYTIGWLHQG
jgi:hypothetical protein